MLNKYKSQFPESYLGGRVSFSITISDEALQLMKEKQISNHSAFINDVLLSALRTESYWTKKALADFEAAKEELTKEGFIVEATVRKVCQ